MNMDRSSNGISISFIIVMNFLVLFFMGNIIQDHLEFFNFMFSKPLNTLIIISISFLSTVFIHELGHLVMGKLVGFNLLEIKIWFFSFSRLQGDSNKPFKFKLKNILSLNGYTFMNPNSTKNFLVKEILFLIGGILFNLVLFLLILYYESANPNIPIQSQVFLTIFAFLQFFLLIVNSFPIFLNENLFDGKKIYNLLFNEPFKNCLNIDSLNIRGIRPKEWIDQNLFLNLSKSLTDYDFSLKLYELQSFMDIKDKEKSGNLVQELLQFIHYPSIEIHDSICIHCALYYSFMDYQVEKIQDCINLVRNKFNPTTLSRAFFNVIEAKVTGTTDQVKNNCLLVLDILNNSPMKGVIEFYSELIN